MVIEAAGKPLTDLPAGENDRTIFRKDEKAKTDDHHNSRRGNAQHNTIISLPGDGCDLLSSAGDNDRNDKRNAVRKADFIR